jgi:hypothetical protein
MLILFFTIVFIAELIILEKVISQILKFKKSISNLNIQIEEFKPQIKSDMKNLRLSITKILNSLNCFVSFVANKRINCSENIKKNLIVKILAFILRIPFKRIWTVVNTVLTIRKLLKSV